MQVMCQNANTVQSLHEVHVVFTESARWPKSQGPIVGQKIYKIKSGKKYDS